MNNAYLKRMPFGIAGDVTRQSQAKIEAQMLDATKPFPGYGLFGKIVANKFVPVSGGEKPGDFYGILVRPYPTQGNPGGVGDILRSGYIAVKLNAGTAGLGVQAYVRVAKPTADKPLGGIEAAADGDNTVPVPGAVFCASADEDGNVELQYNI